MVTREEVLHRLRSGTGYTEIGQQLGIAAGQAYLIATGLPADGSDSLSEADRRREGFIAGGAQALLGVPHHTADHPEVTEWVRRRAQNDAQMQAAHEAAAPSRR
jgi:hypothetical protein